MPLLNQKDMYEQVRSEYFDISGMFLLAGSTSFNYLSDSVSLLVWKIVDEAWRY